MLIKEELLRKLIKLKQEEKHLVNEDKAARKARRAARKEKRRGRQADRDADRFEKEDPGPKLKDVVKNDLTSTSDATYEYVLSEIDRIMPDIEDIEQKFRGVRLIKVLKSRREKRFTIGQVKRFIKTGLAYTKAKDYMEAADEFCAAGAFLESPKTPENKVINVDRDIIDTLYDLCKGLGKGGKFGKKKPPSGGSSRPPGTSTGIITQIQETLNGCAPEMEKLKLDGKWGDKTTAHWRAVVLGKLIAGSTINGVVVTDAIINKILISWPDGGPLLNFPGNPGGCLEFLKIICKKKGEPDPDDPTIPGPSTRDDYRDCKWSSRRTSFTKAEIPVGDLLDISKGGGGLDINLVYDMDEFRKYYPDESFDDFTQSGHYYNIADIKGMGMQFVERHTDGPDEHDTDMMIPADDYYYDCETGELLFSTATGDGVLNDVIVVNDKLFYSRYPDTHVKMARNLTEGRRSALKKRSVSESEVRKFIRGRLIKENVEDYDALLKGLDAGLEIATQGINLAASGMSDDQLKDVIRQTGAYLDNFQKGGKQIEDEIDGAALNKKLELATKFMSAGKNEQAVENFKAVLQMVKTAENFEGKGTTVAVFDSLISVLDSKKKTTVQDIKKLASATKNVKKDNKGSGSSRSSKKGSGNSKVKKIQEILNSINDDKIKVDGKWGTNTQKAYVSFVARTGKKGWINLLKNKTQFTKVSRVKWPEAAKILSSNEVTTFEGNIDGMIKFLEYAAKEYNI